MTQKTLADLPASEWWSCFDCGYFGIGCHYDEDDDECCPVCGCHSGDGFGQAENDPRYRGEAFAAAVRAAKEPTDAQ